MSTDLAQPTRQAIAARGRSLPGKVTGRLLTAVSAMVWQAASRPEAARLAGMTDHSLRQALRRRHVMNYYLQECEVLRLSGRAKRIQRLDEIAASDRNLNASVAAIKAAEQLGEDAGGRVGGFQQQAPGLVVVVQGMPPAPVIDVTPVEAAPEPPRTLWVNSSPDEPVSDPVFRVPWAARR
jgi:hypothetical protein